MVIMNMMVIMILAIIINEDKRAWCPAGGSFPFLVAHPGVKYCFLRFSAQSIHFHDLSLFTIYPQSILFHDLSTIYPFSRSIYNLSFFTIYLQSIHFHDLSTIYHPLSQSIPIHDLSTIYPFSRSIHNLSILRCASS